MTDGSDIEFFGAHIKVRSAKLAALLNSTVTDDVVVVGKRALDLVSSEERDVDVNRALHSDDPAESLEDLKDDDDVVERLADHGPATSVTLRPLEP